MLHLTFVALDVLRLDVLRLDVIRLDVLRLDVIYVLHVIDFCAKFQLNWGSNECAMELKGTNKIEKLLNITTILHKF